MYLFLFQDAFHDLYRLTSTYFRGHIRDNDSDYGYFIIRFEW